MKFTKMQGCGNDYIYVNGFEEQVTDKSEVVRRLSERHFGIGGDGVIFINPSAAADFEMEMYNADGTRGEMCGNGIRCVGKFVYDKRMTDKKTISVESFGKIKYLEMEIQDGKVLAVRVDMGAPELEAGKIPVISEQERVLQEEIKVGSQKFYMTAVSMGNPHVVIVTDNVAEMDLAQIGPEFEHHKRFPNRINTEFVKVTDRSHVEMRVWERGAGETLACGTGACAVVVACILNGLTDNQVTVKLLGGSLTIQWDGGTNPVYMTGPAQTVFEGEIEL